jgi:hypothetical protein
MATIPVGNRHIAKIDEADHEMLSQFKWRLAAHGYACCTLKSSGRSRVVTMHRMIMLPDPGQLIDHANGDPLDNRRENLRLADNSTNQANRHALLDHSSSRFKGVTWNRGLQKWQAQIKVDGRSRHLGLHADEREAARAYDAAARRHFGEYACVNFPDTAERAVAS